jgi:mono/diheme cytochrome c family protein
MRQSTLYLFIFAAIVFSVSCATGGVTNNTNSVVVNNTRSSPEATPMTPVAALTLGKELYAQNCMICHKESGKGGRLTLGGKSLNVEDLTEAKFVKATDEKLIGYVTNGIEDEGMPAFKDKLTAAEIKAVIDHVRTLQSSTDMTGFLQTEPRAPKL